jgi:predicted MFS family arabinose efflux permease
MYGLGFVLLMYPIIGMINEWWVLRKGMAFGVISAASGVSGAALPLGIEWLLARYGYRTTLRVIAVGITICTAPLLPLLKGRLPAAERSQTARTDWTFLRVPLFWVYAVSTLLYGLGFFYPGVYLPSFATAVGLSSTEGAAILAVMSVAQVAGQFACGWASDHSKKFSVSVACVICLLMATISSFVLWGMAKSLGLLMVFGVVYGFFGYGYSTMRVAMGRQVSRDASSTVATYSILVFVQGIGNVLVGPISDGLLGGGVRRDGYGIGRYRDLVVWTGGCMAVSAGVIGLWWVRPSRFKGVC